MAVGKFMRSGGMAALAAALAIVAMPAQAQERGQGRWNRGGDAAAQDNNGGRGENNSERRRGGTDRGARGDSAGQSQGQGQQRSWWRGREARAQAPTPAPAPQAPAQVQTERRSWSGSGQRDGGQWQGRDRRTVDTNRTDRWRDADRDTTRQRAVDSARQRSQYDNRWRNNDGRWQRDNRWQGNRQGYAGNWSRDWRRDNRYDWRGYRSSNRHVYRLSPYYAPYRNYSYRRLSPGFHLEALFFGSRYWINDPWYYRLPPADGPYRWVRYYDDALLVDIYSGEVVDVIYDFFW